MFNLLSRRLLGVLQLTRMALVFTAIADSFCTLALLSNSPHRLPQQSLGPSSFVAIWFMSAGLYGFGMSLNDIIDRRRDRQIAAHRPLPSGRLGVGTAHVICGLLMLLSLGCALYYALLTRHWMSLVFIALAQALIWFYDIAGKYLVAFGLLTLGAIRLCHALVPAPQVPVLWHPLLLFTHVTVLSAVAYSWEQKRPLLTVAHVAVVGAGILVVNGVAISLLGAALRDGDVLWALQHDPAMKWTPWLLLPIGAVVAFVGIAAYIRWRTPGLRDAGQKLMLYGLLWLIVYDACFVVAYVGWWQGLLLLLFLPAAWASVQLMRWWSKIVSLSHRPAFKRART